MSIHLTVLQMWLAVASGGAVGFTLGLIGGGGSILAVPLLLYVVGVHDAHVVIGSTALAVAVNAYLNLIPHWRAGNVRWKSGLAFAVPGAFGAYLGSLFGKWMDGKALLFLFALIMLVIAVLMLRQRDSSAQPVREGGGVRMSRVLPAGLGTGLVSGFFGIGGGFLIVPGLIFSTGMPMTSAIGTSLLSVGTFGLTTAISYTASGLIDWLVVALYVAGGLLGGMAGVWACTRIGQSKSLLQRIFSGILVVVALYMLYDNAQVIKWSALRWDILIPVLGGTALLGLAGWLLTKWRFAGEVRLLKPAELAQKMKEADPAGAQWVDLRHPAEYALGHVPGSANIPLSQLQSRLAEISPDQEVILVCRNRRCVMAAARILKRNGYDRLYRVGGSLPQELGVTKKGQAGLGA